MIARADLIGVALVAFGMVVTPGPNMIYVVSRSITQGRRAGLISLTGVAAGFVAYVCAAAVGLSAVFAAVPALYVGVKLAGACYLGWLAWQAVRPGGVSLFAPVELPHDSPRRLFTMGLLTNLLNPKAAILYASLLPQFIDVRAGHVAQQVLVLGAVQICVSLLVNGALVMCAGSVAGFLRRRPGWLRVQRYVAGTLLGSIAVKLATDKARPVAA